MSWEERFLFHSRLVDLIVRDYAEQRHKIDDSDPEREAKREANKAACTDELRQLNRFFFGQKQTWACRQCPFVTYWMENEGSEQGI